uniref:Uncharacterized protein n=1 Tax=Solanum tuberosum TaxID=4113 RepID=M1DZI5_SOLTU
MNILDLCCSLEDGSIVDIYVKYLIDEPLVDPGPILLENVSHENREESGSTFNKRDEQNGGPNILIICYCEFSYCSPATIDPNDIDVGPVGSDLVEEDDSNYSTEDSVDTEGELVRDDDEDYDSDVHEEVMELRAENRTFQRRKRNE